MGGRARKAPSSSDGVRNLSLDEKTAEYDLSGTSSDDESGDASLNAFAGQLEQLDDTKVASKTNDEYESGQGGSN